MRKFSLVLMTYIALLFCAFALFACANTSGNNESGNNKIESAAKETIDGSVNIVEALAVGCITTENLDDTGTRTSCTYVLASPDTRIPSWDFEPDNPNSKGNSCVYVVFNWTNTTNENAALEDIYEISVSQHDVIIASYIEWSANCWQQLYENKVVKTNPQELQSGEIRPGATKSAIIRMPIETESSLSDLDIVFEPKEGSNAQRLEQRIKISDITYNGNIEWTGEYGGWI